MRPAGFIALCIIAAVCIACSRHDASEAGLSPGGVAMAKFLASVNLADPSKDVDAAIARGDQRLLGFNGFACSAPGVPETAIAGGLNCIEGTSDVLIQGDEPIRAKVISYAEAYNRDLLKRLSATSPNPSLERP